MSVKLPKHITCTITHNDHASSYETVEQWLEKRDPADDECPPEDRAACLATGEVWEVAWYPRTPVSWCSAIAATLERALELANRGED